jgi:hypothetical protein
VPVGFIECFILAQVLLPAVLYLPGTQPFRVLIRFAPFALSLGALGWWLLSNQRFRRMHVSCGVLIFAWSYILLMAFAPTTNTIKAGLAQSMLYLSVMAPVFWVPMFIRSYRQVDRVLKILIICNGINAVVGVLQVYNPDRFLPREFSVIALEVTGGSPLSYEGPDGQRIVRPPGLGDNPGAVVGPATIAAVLGLIVAFREWRRKPWLAAMCAGFAFAGVAAIYLSHVRTNILILGGMFLAYGIALWVQRRYGEAITLAGTAAGLLTAALAVAVAMGGTAVVERFASLIEDDPHTVYYRSGRGIMLEHDTKLYLSEHPFGAGLGRWGMMRYYFGDEGNPRSPPLWAELQIPAWCLDGGFVLLGAYSTALLMAFLYEWRLMRRGRDPRLRVLAAIVLACNAGTLALVFGFTPFTTAWGLQYWFFAGALHGTALLTARSGVGPSVGGCVMGDTHAGWGAGSASGPARTGPAR